MKLLSYHYHLRITTDAPIHSHRFTLRCTPTTDARQRIIQLHRYVFPSDFLSESRDSWGNALVYGCCRGEHTAFETNVCGQAAVGMTDCVPSDNPNRDILFQYPTALTVSGETLMDFGSQFRRSGDALGLALEMMEVLHCCFRYVPGTTTVQTTAEEAFSAGEGVCQDYAHILLAVLRQRSIPCRYVAGMLLGEGKSHAWVEVLHRGSWYALDPTHNQMVTDSHIKLSHGRDYRDCTINRGLFRGTAGQSTDVSVIVTET